MNMSIQRWTVVFLVDADPPSKIVLLKRALDMKFAPGWYSGIGGKQENDESIQETAYRELKEETGIEGVHLTEFARALNIDSKKQLHYFWGVYNDKVLPPCTEGILEWVAKDRLLTKQITSTTLSVVQEWIRRGFALDQRWTFHVSGKEDKHGMAVDIEVVKKTHFLLE